MTRSLKSIFLALVISFGLFINPASADFGSSVKNWTNGFWYGFGAFVGGSVGAVATCYVVDVAIAPVAPPVAAYLATVCPYAGVIAGSAVGGKTLEAVVAH